MLKKISLLLLILCAGFTGNAQTPKMNPSSEQFLKALRMPGTGDTWGKMSGKVYHRRKGADPVEAPISFRTLLSSRTTIGQLIFREKEICQLTQSRVEPFSSSVETNGPSTLEDMGIRPSDLVMNFIYWKFLGELPRETIRMQECRILVFESPDTKEKVKVFVNASHIFPVRVQWLGKEDSKPYRTLEVNGLKKVGDLWVVEELAVSGPGWKSRIHFNQQDAGYTKHGIPTDLFAE